MAEAVKTPPVMQETQVQSLGREDPLEKGMVTYSSILAWKILRTDEPGGLQFTRSFKSLFLCLKFGVLAFENAHVHIHSQNLAFDFRGFTESPKPPIHETSVTKF